LPAADDGGVTTGPATSITVNGVTIPIVKGSFKEVPEFIGELAERGAAGEFDENFVARKRKYTATVLAQDATKAVALRKLLEGDGQSWLYDSNTYSFKGEGPSAGGSYTQSGAGGSPSGGKVTVASGNTINYALATALGVPSGWAATKGWSLIVRKKLSVGDGGDGSTFFRHIALGAVAVVQGASANPAGVTQYKSGAAGSFAMGNWITVDGAGDGVVKLHGKDNANVNAAYDYCDLAFLPFQLDSSWIAGLDTFLTTNRYPTLKRVMLSGAHIEDAAPGILVHIRQVGASRTVRLRGTTIESNWRAQDIQIWEA
jgi:hypothetical protein